MYIETNVNSKNKYTNQSVNQSIDLNLYSASSQQKLK